MHACTHTDVRVSIDGLDSFFTLFPPSIDSAHTTILYSVRSFRELPIRMAEFGVLHRNEVSGSLTGR